MLGYVFLFGPQKGPKKGLFAFGDRHGFFKIEKSEPFCLKTLTKHNVPIDQVKIMRKGSEMRPERAAYVLNFATKVAKAALRTAYVFF